MRLVVPSEIFGGFYRKFRLYGIFISFGILAHTLQCDQRWIFLIHIGKRRFGYRTVGDASKNLTDYYDHGWYVPWNKRTCSGRG